MTLDTARLLLVPQHPADLLALIQEGYEAYAARTGRSAAAGLREQYTGGVSSHWLDRLRAATGPDPWTLGFVTILKDENQVVAGVGFKGEPDADGMVEIGYGVADAYQNKGYATEMAAAAVRYALADARVREVRAHTLTGTGPSQRVLAKCGFRPVGEVIDPEDGLVLRWVYDPNRQLHADDADRSEHG